MIRTIDIAFQTYYGMDRSMLQSVAGQPGLARPPARREQGENTNIGAESVKEVRWTKNFLVSLVRLAHWVYEYGLTSGGTGLRPTGKLTAFFQRRLNQATSEGARRLQSGLFHSFVKRTCPGASS